MGIETNNKTITAVIPAYNEALRLGGVLDVMVSYPGFKEIIVVDDGSADGTSGVAKKYGVKVLRHEKNLGKGRAIESGIASGSGEIIFISDADIKGLTHEMIDEIISPVKDEKVDMFIGLQERQIYSIRPVLLFTPLLGGERAFTRELWNKIPQEYKERFRMETALNFYALHEGKSFRYKYFQGLGQTTKEKKYGFRKGITGRFKMIGDIVSVNWQLHGESPAVSWPVRLWRSFFTRLQSVTEQEIK